MAGKTTIRYERLDAHHHMSDEDIHDLSLLSEGLGPKVEVKRTDLILAAMNGHILVARFETDNPEERSRIVGVGRLVFNDSLFTGRDAVIADMVVRRDKRFRGKGVGRTIGKLLIGIAKEHGVRYIWLRSNKKRVEAQGLYRSLGFKRQEDVYIFDKVIE